MCLIKIDGRQTKTRDLCCRILGVHETLRKHRSSEPADEHDYNISSAYAQEVKTNGIEFSTFLLPERSHQGSFVFESVGRLLLLCFLNFSWPLEHKEIDLPFRSICLSVCPSVRPFAHPRDWCQILYVCWKYRVDDKTLTKILIIISTKR